MRAVILAAGLGSRLGKPLPKALTVLSDGRTILERQLAAIESAVGVHSTMIVVGFKKELLLEAAPEALFVYNPDFGETNTSKSLLRVLELSGDGGVLWMNGDVVFDSGFLERVVDHARGGGSFICVNEAQTADEEVKYRRGSDGFVVELSKTVVGAEGEAVGINFVSAADKPVLIEMLRQCADGDYFERGIELAIERGGCRFGVLSVGDAMCIEIDFQDDLDAANAQLVESDGK